jgi:hypothetical protein
MQRREFFIRLSGAVVLGGATLAWLHAAHAQQPGKPPTIGFMGNNPAFWRPYVAAFVERLGELGWVDGHTTKVSALSSVARGGVESALGPVWCQGARPL